MLKNFKFYLMKKPSLFLLIILLSFTTCKKEKNEEEKKAKISEEFDYVFSAEHSPLNSFPLLSNATFTMKHLSGTPQEVKLKLTLPDGIKCWIKDSTMLSGTELPISFGQTKPLVVGTYTYTVETSSPGTETKVFTGTLSRPKELCASLYTGDFDVREECQEVLGSDVEVSNYKVSLTPDPLIDNMLIIENFKGRPDWNARVVVQCNASRGADPDTRTKLVLYQTTVSDSIEYFYGRMEPSKLTIRYALELNGKRNNCFAIYTR